MRMRNYAVWIGFAAVVAVAATWVVFHQTESPESHKSGARGDGQSTVEMQAVDPTRGTRWALLVGVDNYDSEALEPLSYCRADVLALRDALVQQAKFPADHVLVLHDKQEKRVDQPLRNSIRRTLAAFLAQARPEDLVLVSFSGHGMQVGSTSYLCPADADPDQPESTMLPVPWLYEQLQNDCKAAQKLVLVDACRNNPRGGRSAQSAMAKDFSQQLRQVPEGLLVLSSCKAAQASWEDDTVRHGVFMHYVLEGLSGKADQAGEDVQGNQNGQVELDELFNYVAVQTGKFVLHERKKSQTPEMYGVRSGPPIVLSRIAQVGPSVIPIPLPQPQPTQLESSPPTALPPVVAAMSSAAQPMALPPKAGSHVSPDHNLCIQCHGNADVWDITDPKAKKMYIPRDGLAEDVHWKKGVNCHDCHGGNYKSEDVSEAHTKESGFRGAGEAARKICTSCHEGQGLEPTKGIHAKAGKKN